MSPAQRLGRAWRSLQPEQRLAAVAAILLLLSMALPWYEVTTSFSVDDRPTTQSVTRSAFGAYSFVEAAMFLVALGVLVLLFARGERRAFHLPGGDGTVIMAGGLWVMLLIFYRQLDKPDIETSGDVAGTVGVSWGIFIAFLLGALLAYAGWRIRAAQIAEPPADDVAPSSPPGRGPGGERRTSRTERRAPGRPRRRRTEPAGTGPPMEGQLSFDEAERDAHAPTPRTDVDPTTIAWDEPPTRRARRRDVFERPADPDEPSEFDPPRRRR